MFESYNVRYNRTNRKKQNIFVFEVLYNIYKLLIY